MFLLSQDLVQHDEHLSSATLHAKPSLPPIAGELHDLLLHPVEEPVPPERLPTRREMLNLDTRLRSIKRGLLRPSKRRLRGRRIREQRLHINREPSLPPRGLLPDPFEGGFVLVINRNRVLSRVLRRLLLEARSHRVLEQSLGEGRTIRRSPARVSLRTRAEFYMRGFIGLCMGERNFNHLLGRRGRGRQKECPGGVGVQRGDRFIGQGERERILTLSPKFAFQPVFEILLDRVATETTTLDGGVVLPPADNIRDPQPTRRSPRAIPCQRCLQAFTLRTTQILRGHPLDRQSRVFRHRLISR